MMNTPPFYEVSPRTAGLDRLDIREDPDEWSQLRDLLQHDLEALDQAIRTDLPTVKVRAGSNRGGGAYLFAYRVYEPAPDRGIDPVVVGVMITPGHAGSGDAFKVSGDISGETRGDILFELPTREVVGWAPMTEAARDLCENLARQPGAVVAALLDSSRQE